MYPVKFLDFTNSHYSHSMKSIKMGKKLHIEQAVKQEQFWAFQVILTSQSAYNINS